MLDAQSGCVLHTIDRLSKQGREAPHSRDVEQRVRQLGLSVVKHVGIVEPREEAIISELEVSHAEEIATNANHGGAAAHVPFTSRLVCNICIGTVARVAVAPQHTMWTQLI